MANKTCITPFQEEKLQKAIDDGEFSLEKIQKTKSSTERVELVSKYFDDEVLVKKVVREIEKRLGSKKEDIVENYMTRNFSSIPENTTKGIFNKFRRMSKFLGAKEEKDFLEELVGYKFGAYVTKEEANNFEKLTNEAVILKEKIDLKATDITPESRAYGEKLIELENAEARIIVKRSGFNVKDYQKLRGQKGGEAVANWSKYLIQAVAEGSGATRAFKATADVSAVFRQLWKVFSSGVTESAFSLGQRNEKLKIWWGAVKTTGLAVKETAKYGDERTYNAIRAEIHAHPNSYNGIFDAAPNSYALRVGSEEQFPSSVPSDTYDKYVGKTNNIFKISEVAFNATVLKARFDLANLTIATLKKADANVMDKDTAKYAGEFVSAFTGRGGLGSLEQGSSFFNKILFAPKYAASQFSPYFQIAAGITTRADDKAARIAVRGNLEFIIGSLSMIVAAETARGFIMGDKPDYTGALNPLSNRFGRVTFPGTAIGIDFTGGNRSVVGLMSNLYKGKYYDARLGIWREKGFFQMSDGKPYYDFVTAKFAPVPAVLRDMIKGEHFGGKEVTPQSIVTNLLMPITVDNVLTEGVSKNDWSSALLVLAGEGLGLGATDIRFKPSGNEWRALNNTDEKAYWSAVDELWTVVHTEVKKLRTDEAFQALPKEKQAEKLERIYSIQLKKIIKQQEYKEIYAEKLQEMEDEKKK